MQDRAGGGAAYIAAVLLVALGVLLVVNSFEDGVDEIPAVGGSIDCRIELSPRAICHVELRVRMREPWTSQDCSSVASGLAAYRDSISAKLSPSTIGNVTRHTGYSDIERFLEVQHGDIVGIPLLSIDPIGFHGSVALCISVPPMSNAGFAVDSCVVVDDESGFRRGPNRFRKRLGIALASVGLVAIVSMYCRNRRFGCVQ